MKFFIYFLFLFLIGCSSTVTDQTAKAGALKKPMVAVSIPAYLFFVEQIARDTIEVKNLIPAEADPHHFEPSAKHLDLAVKAKIWFISKEAFEEEFIPLVRPYNPNLQVFDLTENIDLIDNDLHVWLSPKIAVLQARKIASVLEKAFPNNRQFYKKNLKNLISRIKQTDREIAHKLQGIGHKTILTSHSAFTYFCKDYGLKQLSVENAHHKEPTLKSFYQLFKQAQKEGVKKIFIQAQVDNKGAVLIAEKLNVSPIMVDPYSEDYLTNLKKLADLISTEQ